MAQKIGKYEVIEELGRGAMGVVYKGKDPFIGRFVALKTITTGLQDQPELLQRFYREAQAAGGLQHPNVVTIYDLGEAQDGTPYIAMEFLEGEDLEKYIHDQRAVPLSQKINYIVQVASALNYAHKRGVVHRDIKPANIVVTKEGTPKVLDFGIARLVDTSRSQTGLLIGTVNYMSPEQVRGERVDARSDIFSLGVMFYELVCWQRPFIGNNFTAVMLAIISQEPRALAELAPDCPKDLSDIVHKLLRKDVGDRYQSLEEFLIDVDPVWKRLQRESVTGLVSEGERLMKSKEFSRARDVLRQAVLIDTSHMHAKTLLEKVNAELKRSMVLPELEERVSKAQSLLKDGRLDEATQEAKAALKLDSMFAPAQELLKQVQEEANRQKTVKELLRTTKQRLAEGSLTEAEQSLGKVLELETGTEAQGLKRQLEEEKARRETRKRLLDSMQQARNLWTQQKYSESIQILTQLQMEFPNEGEVAKLLETVREDQAEQSKHQSLAQAKAMLAEQRFADALALLEPVLQERKNDTAVRKLYDHIRAEEKVHAQRARLEREQAAVRKLVNEEKWSEALAQGEVLMKEFPDEVELARTVEYARSQQAMVEHQRKLKEKSTEVLRWLDKADYPKAIKAAEQGLEQFPGNLELKQMLEEARAKQQEKEHKDFVEKQIRSIKAAINRGEQTEAIDLARQTLAVVKHDTAIGDLLKMAERDRDLRDQKKSQDDQLKTVAMLLKKEKFDEASAALKSAEKTQIFNPLDPRVQELAKAIKEKRAPMNIGALSGKEVPAEGTVAAQYVYAPPGKPALEPEAVGPRAQASAPSAEPMGGTVALPPMAAPAPPPQVIPEPPKPEIKAPAKEEPKKKAKPSVEAPPPKKGEPPKKAAPVVEEPGSATSIFQKPVAREPAPTRDKKDKAAMEPAASSTAIFEKPKEKEKKKEVAAESAPASVTTILERPKGKPAVEERPAVRPAAKAEPGIAEPMPGAIPAEASKKSPAMMMGIAAAVVLAAVVGYFVMRGGGAALTDAQKQVYDQAQQLFAQGNKDAALAKYQEFVALGVSGDEKSAAEARIAEIQKGFASEQSAFDAARNALAQKDLVTAESKYREVIALNGKLKAVAESGLGTVEAMKQGQDPAAIERNKFAQATAEFRRGNYPLAQSLFQEVLGINGANRGAAEQQLQVIETRLTEERVFKEGMDLKGGRQNDQAVAKFEEVVGMNGALKTQAQTQIRVIRNAAAAADAVQKLNTDAQGAIGQKNYRQARSLIEQIQSLGGNANDLSGRLNTAEKQEYDALAGRFNQLKAADDDTGLRALGREAQALADGGGSQADSARHLASNQIPAAIKDIVDRKQAVLDQQRRDRETKEKADWDAAIELFNNNQKDPATLRGRVTTALQAIASGSGAYAGQARDTLAKIPALVSTVRPCPTNSFGEPVTNRSLIATPRAGDLVASTLLDAKPAWSVCTWPTASGAAPAQMTLTVDENGIVVEVKPRGAVRDQVFFAAAEQAVRTWQANPTPKSKGVPVKTTAIVDIRP